MDNAWVSRHARMGVVWVAYRCRIAVPKRPVLHRPTYPYGVVSVFRTKKNFACRRGPTVARSYCVLWLFPKNSHWLPNVFLTHSEKCRFYTDIPTPYGG